MPGRKQLTLEEFIDRSNKVHNFKYNYSKVVYINSQTKVIIICPVHGDFKQLPIGHYGGKGCEKCAYELKNKIMSQLKIAKAAEEFLGKAIAIHGNRFDYSKVVYRRHNVNVIIICPVHGEILQTPACHLIMDGCTKCSYEKKSKEYLRDQKDVINQLNLIHNFKYDYSKFIYIGGNEKAEIICHKHGSFWQKVHHHIGGQGCSKCTSNVSKVETAWLDYLNVPFQFRQLKLTIDSKNFRTDALDLENKTIWEFYGDYWHGNPNVLDPNKINFANKKTFGELYDATIKRENLLKEFGYNLITIWESDWKKIAKGL